MRSRHYVIACTTMILCAWTLYARNKKSSWMDEAFTQWDQKQVNLVFNNSAWAQTKEFRGQASGEHGTVTDRGSTASATNGGVTGVGGGTLGVDNPEYSFTARFFSAQPIREAYVRMLQIMNKYDTLPAERQKEFDQKVDGLLHADVSQEVTVTLSYHTNDPNAQRDMNQWFNTQTTDTLKQNAYLYTPGAGQITLLKYIPPQGGGGGLGARFIFPRTLNGEPILQPGAAGRLRFQLSWQPQIGQIMYIDFKPEGMTYKGQFSY
ncbi:MAG TPA: hypothetical protein VGV68_08010 [Terriglobia bacterium]|nr:hypothetical protein [Terriglobia bacterium]